MNPAYYPYEYASGMFVQCKILRELRLKNGVVELLIWVPLTRDTIYIYETER